MIYRENRNTRSMMPLDCTNICILNEDCCYAGKILEVVVNVIKKTFGLNQNNPDKQLCLRQNNERQTVKQV